MRRRRLKDLVRQFSRAQVKEAYLCGKGDKGAAKILKFGPSKGAVKRVRKLRKFYRIKTAHQLPISIEVLKKVDVLCDAGFSSNAISKMPGMPCNAFISKRRRKCGKPSSIAGAHKWKAQQKALAKKGQRFTAIDGQVFEYTGGISRYTFKRARGVNVLWIPDVKCVLAAHVISTRSSDNRHGVSYLSCEKCIERAGGAKTYAVLKSTGKKFGYTGMEYWQAREKAKNENGLILCAVCGVAEIHRRHGQDHDHRMGNPRHGKGNRGFLCQGCNVYYVHEAEKIISGVRVMPPKTEGPGWEILKRAMKYVKKWDRVLGMPRKKPT